MLHFPNRHANCTDSFRFNLDGHLFLGVRLHWGFGQRSTIGLQFLWRPLSDTKSDLDKQIFVALNFIFTLVDRLCEY